MTKKLYEVDPYLTECISTIKKIEEDDKGDYWASFDQTIFYPQSGGQPFDLGKIDKAQVLNVQLIDGEIFHKISGAVSKQRVKMTIDFERRFDHMQQHTGQHLLSAVWIELFGIETRSFHLGQDICTIDLNTNELNEVQMMKVEQKISEYIFENRTVESYIKHTDEVDNAHFSKLKEKPPYVRFVEIEDIDVSTCCGTHVNNLGELGFIKILSWEKYKNAVRLTFICGNRAIKYFQLTHRIASQIGKKLNVSVDLAEERFLQFYDTHLALKKDSQKQYEKAVHYEAAELLSIEKSNWIIRSWNRRNLQEMKDLAKIIIGEQGKTVAFHSEEDHTWILASSSSDDFNVSESIRILKERFGGNGGGNSVFGQWTGSLTLEEWKQFFYK